MPSLTAIFPARMVHAVLLRLLSGSYVRFQPRMADFQRDAGEDVGDALTTALMTHAALSVGDWLEVPLGDASYDLRVMELRPAPTVSVIGALFWCAAASAIYLAARRFVTLRPSSSVVARLDMESMHIRLNCQQSDSQWYHGTSVCVASCRHLHCHKGL